MDRRIITTAIVLAFLSGGCSSSQIGSPTKDSSKARTTSPTASSARSRTHSALLRSLCAQVPPALRASPPSKYFPRDLAALWETPQVGQRCILVFPAANNKGRVIWASGKRDWNGIAWAPGGTSIVIDTTTNAINAAATAFAPHPGAELVRWFTRSGRLLSARPGRALGFFPDGTLVLARNGDLFLAKSQGTVRRLAPRRIVASIAGFRGTYLSSESGTLGLRTSQDFGNDAVAFVVHQLAPRFAERVIIAHQSGAIEAASPLFHQPGEVDSAVGGVYWNPTGTELFEANTRPSHNHFDHDHCLDTWTHARGYRRVWCGIHRPGYAGHFVGIQWAADGATALLNNGWLIDEQGHLLPGGYRGSNAAFAVAWSRYDPAQHAARSELRRI